MNDKILQKLKFNKFSLIQEKTMNEFENPNHLVIVAPTGTGKTHSYLVPIYKEFEKKPKLGLKLVILVPTNELVFQVYEMTKELFSNSRIRIFYGSMDRQREIKWLENNQIDIAIGTPIKIEEFIKNGSLSFQGLEYLVFDEADMMFDEAFMEPIIPILRTSKLGKLILVSASITETMKPFIKEFFGSYKLIDTTSEDEIDIKHYLVKAGTRTRDFILKDLLRLLNPYFCIIFVSKKEDQLEVFNLLNELDLNVAHLSGDMPVRVRRQVIKDISDLKYQYLVTSDIASRGIDFDASHIINYDLPYHLEYFIHRSGRTGRMGQSGEVYTIEGPNDHRKIDNLTKRGIDFNEIKLTQTDILKVEPKVKTINETEIQVIRKIKKPTKVKPNYRKKNKKKIEKALKEHRRREYAKNRKSR
ncbi:MAG: DEAD/DEAH box helicase [Acholeplasmataceae bacterium]|jgi:ATP-dependent RNA helicase CshB